jgi:hypothetical protein
MQGDYQVAMMDGIKRAKVQTNLHATILYPPQIYYLLRLPKT